MEKFGFLNNLSKFSSFNIKPDAWNLSLIILLAFEILDDFIPTRFQDEKQWRRDGLFAFYTLSLCYFEQDYTDIV